MDVKELVDTLINARKGLAYRLWKQACLNKFIMSSEFPESPEIASPELYPPPKTYKMYDFLKNGSRKGEIKNGR